MFQLAPVEIRRILSIQHLRFSVGNFEYLSVNRCFLLGNHFKGAPHAWNVSSEAAFFFQRRTGLGTAAGRKVIFAARGPE